MVRVGVDVGVGVGVNVGFGVGVHTNLGCTLSTTVWLSELSIRPVNVTALMPIRLLKQTLSQVQP